MQESYWVKLKDPNQFQRGRERARPGCPGVAAVRDLRQVLKPIYFWMTVMKWGAIAIAAFLLVAAILQVGNTIRMAAFARRKEIGIMRLVGASNLYISLPFLMETLVAALIGHRAVRRWPCWRSCSSSSTASSGRAPTSSSGSTGTTPSSRSAASPCSGSC